MLTICFFFFNDTATTEIYTLSLHDALPILVHWRCRHRSAVRGTRTSACSGGECYVPARCSHGMAHPSSRSDIEDRKSTRLNSSHMSISYAVFCLKKKKSQNTTVQRRLERIR